MQILAENFIKKTRHPDIVLLSEECLNIKSDTTFDTVSVPNVGRTLNISTCFSTPNQH